MASKVDIVNAALAMLGAERVSSLSENTKLARMGDTLYDRALEEVLAFYPWSFARKTARLEEVDEEHPLWQYVYEKPADCAMPIDLLPLGSKTAWEVEGERILCNFTPAYLVYVMKNPPEGNFPGHFVAALSAVLAGKMSYSILQDKEMMTRFVQLGKAYLEEAAATDANIGNIHVHPDNDPRYDTFINPSVSSDLMGWDENGDS